MRRISVRASRLVRSMASRAVRALGSPVERGQPGPGLDHDHADMMGDDVVQLAGDPLALVLDGAARSLLALGLLEAGVLLDRGGVAASRPSPIAEGQHDDDGKHRLDEPGDSDLVEARLGHDDAGERHGNRQRGRDRDAPFVALGDGEQRHERAEALVDDLPLDQGGVQGGRRDRDRKDRDRPPPPDDEREGLEQEQGDAERIALARVGRATREREERERRETEGDRPIDQPRDHG